MLHSRAVGIVRAYATVKDTPFLSDAIAKAAIGKDAKVATSFVSAFAPVIHRQRVHVASVSSLPGTTGLSLVRDMKHDIALRYSVEGEATEATAVMEVVPQRYNRALVEIQRQPETYLPGRALAHASGHYLAAVDEVAKAVKSEKQKARDEAKSPTNEQHRKPRSSAPRANFDTAVYTAYVRVEPVHLLMLSDFCYAHDTAAGVWRAPKSSSVLAGGKYGWASPLFSTFRLMTDVGSVRLVAGLDDPGPSAFASSLWNRLSITIVHLPMVPVDLRDDAAWRRVATLPEHMSALENPMLRQWLRYLAHSFMKGGKVQMPEELQASDIFRKSAEMAEELVHSSNFSYSEKDMADFELQKDRETKAALANVRAAAVVAAEAAAAALANERAAAVVAAEAAAAALANERAAAVAAAAEAAAAAALQEERMRKLEAALKEKEATAAALEK